MRIVIERKNNILYFRWPEKFDLEDARHAMVALKAALLAVPGPSACINDAGNIRLGDMLSKAMRVAFTEFIEKEKDFLNAKTLCWADVSMNPFVRSFARMIRFISRPGYPAESFATMMEAEGWCRDHIARLPAPIVKASR